MDGTLIHTDRVKAERPYFRPEGIARFFAGLELVVEAKSWGEAEEVDEFCGVAKKP